MNPLMNNMRLIMTVCMEIMDNTAHWMKKASVEIPEFSEHAEELHAAAALMDVWIDQTWKDEE